MTREQQERVKAQIRAELAGVDTRAFKGPLRDILQKHDYTPRPVDMQTSPLSASSDPMQAGVAPSFSLFPDYELAGQPRSQSGQPVKREPQDQLKTDEEMPPLTQRPSELRTRSSTFEGGLGAMSYPPARHSQSYLPDWARQTGQSSRDVHYHQQQQHHQQQQQQHYSQQRPHMPPPIMSQSQLAQRGGPVSMASAEHISAPVGGYGPGPDGRRPLKRESSGLTVSPQEAFLDYDDVENALSHSGLGKMPSLFATVPPGLSDAKPGPGRYQASHSGTNTPRMMSSQNVPRARSSTGEPTYAARPVPMSRNDTARPHHYQKRPGPTVQQGTGSRSPYPGHSDGRGSASQSGSQSSLFSPVDSGDTISTDDDEDERPYYPPNMRPSMIRGGPSSLYLNYPTKADGRVSASPSALPRPLLGKERTSSSGPNGAWSHVRNEPWALRQAHMQPRFSDVSASSSDSDDDRSGRRWHRQERSAYPHHHHYPQYQQPHSRQSPLDPRTAQRPPLPHHQSSSEDVDDTDRQYGRPYPPRHDSRSHMPGALGGYGYIPGSQESGLSVAPPHRDEGSISPSIRRSAPEPPPLLTARPAPTAAPARAPPSSTDSLPIKDDRIETGGDAEDSETGTNSNAGNESDYEDSPETHPKKPASEPKPRTSSNGSNAKPGGIPATDGTTKCDYVSPITHIACQTAFHRPYDLARHRETIHAREEAGFMREGKLKLQDCVVLGKEVDPKKSTAVVEWKCKTCGANFSRKDAMLRHERLRHNAAK
uniref:C2H2-type domain-containing protein n=2 Tax=Kalmanozyma brasiliensis (strain GHG001) TaxID=1365824 RepID=V5F232_KALBG